MADAWSLTMNGKKDDYHGDQPLLSDLMERVEHIESQASRAECVIEDLQQRLTKAERKLTPFDNQNIPWRRIYACPTIRKRSVEDGEFKDSDVKPDEEYQLPMDIYSVIATWKPRSRPFFTAMVIVGVQITLLVLLLTDQIGSKGSNEIVAFPSNVPSVVHAAQALATIIAILDQDDLRSAIENFCDGLPTRFKGDITFQGMSKAQWNFSCFIRFVQGFLSVLSAFILAVQSETVFDVLLNFLGVKFVSELDDLSFSLSRIGYFGVKCEIAAKRISEVQFQQDDRNKVDETTWNRYWFYKYAHVFGVFGILALLFSVFLWVLIGQNTGSFAPQVVSMISADDFPFAALFNGCYQVSPQKKFHHRRPAYEQVGFPKSGARFGFCDDLEGEQAWVFLIGEMATDPCVHYSGRSAATTTFSVVEAGNYPWYPRGSARPFGNVEIVPVPEDSIGECGRVPFDRNKTTCSQLEFEGHLSAGQQESRSKFFNKVYLDNSNSTVYTYPALTHPIYIGNSSVPGKYDLVLFTGQSWVMTNIIESNLTAEQSGLSMKEYLDSDLNFPGILYNVIYEADHVDMVTNSVNDENQYTPLGMRWYRPQDGDPSLGFNYPTADLSRPMEISLSCATCNNSTNPCFFGGICLEDGICDCINGGSGALCTEIPAGDAFCNPYFNIEQYEWDGGDCCGSTCTGPQCGLGGVSRPFGIDAGQERDPFSVLGYEFCEDPTMAPLTIEVKNFEIFQDDEFNAVMGWDEGTSICSTSTVNVRCDGISYLHFPQYTFMNESDCLSSFTETIQVPFGSECEIATSIACFGIYCLDHSVTVYYGGDTASIPMRSANVKNQTSMSFGVPAKCLTKVLLPHSSSIFDVSTHQGRAASALSNDVLSEFLCVEHPNLALERYALAVFNSSMHFKSSNWDAYQCHGWGSPAVRTACSNWSMTELTLAIDAGNQAGTIPTELALLTNLEFLVLRMNSLTGTIPTELSTLLLLQGLEIWSNNLTGTIPTELANLSSLKALGLAWNQLTGTIPTELGSVKTLTGIWISDNMLTGPIPSEIGSMPALASLYVENNTLTGEIPAELLALTDLASCNMQNNNFTGGIAPVGCGL